MVAGAAPGLARRLRLKPVQQHVDHELLLVGILLPQHLGSRQRLGNRRQREVEADGVPPRGAQPSRRRALQDVGVDPPDAVDGAAAETGADAFEIAFVDKLRENRLRQRRQLQADDALHRLPPGLLGVLVKVGEEHEDLAPTTQDDPLAFGGILSAVIATFPFRGRE